MENGVGCHDMSESMEIPKGETEVCLCDEWISFCCDEKHTIDSVFNAALLVTDLNATVSRVIQNGGSILVPPRSVEDTHGVVEYSIITTGYGNITHTLIDKSRYHGEFLPGFVPVASTEDNTADGLATHFDHIALVCEEGRGDGMLQWYQDVFKMKRFLINSEEDLMEGFTIRENVGLRLKALEYWRCFERGATVGRGDTSLKVVVGEPISAVPRNHVAGFLRAHRGAGLQHAALHCPALLQAAQAMRASGAAFRATPQAYYHQGGALAAMAAVGLGSVSGQLAAAGVLLDTEAGGEGYLLQIFTKPLFAQETFFLELVHRAGAEGFGVGNITALARSIALEQARQG